NQNLHGEQPQWVRKVFRKHGDECAGRRQIRQCYPLECSARGPSCPCFPSERRRCSFLLRFGARHTPLATWGTDFPAPVERCLISSIVLFLSFVHPRFSGPNLHSSIALQLRSQLHNARQAPWSAGSPP